MKIILFGPPGAGKGTQANLLSKKFGIPTVSTGALIRDEIAKGTEFGKKVEIIINGGNLISDEDAINLAKERLKDDDCKNGFILDGFPRTIPQAIALEKMGVSIDKALSIEVDDEDIVKRLEGRRECKVCRRTFHVSDNPPKEKGICDNCGGELIRREDDAPEVIRERLKVYHRQTEDLIKYYADKGLLVTAKSQKELEDTEKEVLRALGVGE